MTRTVVLGAGQLGWALAAPSVDGTDTGVHLLDRARLDLADLEAIEPALAALRPDVVINAAAYNRVDEAESRPDLAFAINAAAPARIARAAGALGARMVHVSTDYVFSGAATLPYHEDDLPGPINIYGASKLAGEHLVRAYAPQALILRTSGVFGTPRQGQERANFVQAILRQVAAGAGDTRPELRVVDDQTVGPTYAVDLAAAIRALIERGATGTMHVTNAGACTWFEFARAILNATDHAEVPITPVRSAARPTAARRPAYSVLDGARLRGYGIVMPHWRDALHRYLKATGLRTVEVEV